MKKRIFDPNSTVVKRECSEVFGEQDYGQALVLIGTKGPCGHDQSFAKTEFFAEVIEPDNKLRVENG